MFQLSGFYCKFSPLTRTQVKGRLRAGRSSIARLELQCLGHLTGKTLVFLIRSFTLGINRMLVENLGVGRLLQRKRGLHCRREEERC